MSRILKKDITGATPSQIVEILTIYKEGIEIPLLNLWHVLSCLEKGQNHLFAMVVKNDKVYLEYSETIQELKQNGR